MVNVKGVGTVKKIDKINEELIDIKEKLMIKEEKLFNMRNGSDNVECSLEKEVKELRKQRRNLLTQKAQILKREGKVEKLKSEIVNLKINYIKRAGRYEFLYDKMDDGKWYHYRVNYTFDETNHIKNDKLLSDIYGKGKYEKLDLDLCEALRKFDVANGTRYCRTYINDTANFNISYDMRGRNKKLSRKENKRLDKIAEIQSMFKNAKLRKPRKKLSYTLWAVRAVARRAVAVPSLEEFMEFARHADLVTAHGVGIEVPRVDDGIVHRPDEERRGRHALFHMVGNGIVPHGFIHVAGEERFTENRQEQVVRIGEDDFRIR